MNNKTDRKYKILLDLSSDGIHVLNKNGKVIDYSQSFREMLDYSDEEMKNLYVEDFNYQFKKDEILDIIDSLFNNLDSTAQRFETKYIKKDKTIIDVQIYAKVVVIDDEKYLYASSRDITQEKLNEEKLEKQRKELELEKRKLQTIVHNLPDLLWIKDADGKYIICNKRFEDLYGRKVEEIVGKTDYDFVSKELADFFRSHDKNAMNSSIPLSNFEELTFASDGHIEYLNTTKVKILDENGNIFGVLGIGRDLTKIKNYQEELEREKTKYKNFMERSSDAIFIINSHGQVIEFSEQFKKILGYEHDEVYNLKVSDFEAIHTKEQINNNIKNIGFTPMQFDSVYKRKDGSLFDVAINIVRVIINENDFLYCSFRDISERKRLQKNLLAQKKEFETIFDYSHDSIAIIDFETNFLKFNKAFINLLEYSEDELLSTCCNNFVLTNESEKNQSIIKKIKVDGHLDNIEKSFITKTGKHIVVNISASLLPDNKRIILNMKDISTLKMMEEQSKLASMGEMIGNIAHQWRQPLSVITTNISGLKLKSDLSGIEQRDIDICEESILKQAKYLSNTIDNFRNFIKGDRVDTDISLKTILENALGLVESSFHNNFIEVIVDLKDDLEIFGNKNELAEAFINIFNNTKDALKSNVKNENDRLLFVKSKLIDKDTIEVEILDSGMGIKDEILNKIFEPYFTTKHQSQGTGLGLSMADKIIRERHGGSLKVSNEEFEYNGKKYYGASFKIIFSLKK